MQSPGTPATRPFNLASVPTIVRGARGMRALVEFAPKPTSPERVVAGVVTRLDTGEVSFTCAIDGRRVEHAFGDTGAALYAIALKLCESLAQHWQTDPDATAWHPPFSGARLADLSRFSGRNASESQHLMLNRSSAIHTLLQSYDIKQIIQPKGIVERIKSVVSSDPNNKYLVPRFGRELTLGDELQSLKVDFLGTHFACYFLQISDKTRGLEANTERALARLYSLQALRKFIQKPRKSLGLLDDERPDAFELMMIGDRTSTVQRRAIYQVEAMADKGQIRALAIPTVRDAADHVASKERRVA